MTLVPQELLKGNSRNYFPSIATTLPVLSIKLNNCPDGGIARYLSLPYLSRFFGSQQTRFDPKSLQLFGSKADGKVADMSNDEWARLAVQEYIAKLSPIAGFPAHFQPPGTCESSLRLMSARPVDV